MKSNSGVEAPGQSFELFAATTGQRVRRALVAYYGVEIGSEAAAEAISVAWQRWDDVATMANAAGFLFRVGQSRARPNIRWARRIGPFPLSDSTYENDQADLVDLFSALARLRPEQRAAVLMVKSYGFSYREVAELLGISESAVTNHVLRGLVRLRTTMEVQ